LGVVLLLLTGFLSYQTAHVLVNWERLTIREFRLQQPPRYCRGGVEELLKGYRGNILTIDLAELRRSLMQFGEIRDVAITRLLPQTIEIAFTLRQPLFQLSEGSGYALYDTQGIRIHQLSTPQSGLIPVTATRAADMVRLVASFPTIAAWRDRLESVSFATPYGLQIKLKELPEILYPGEGDLAAKIAQYLAIKPRLALDTAIAYADLRLENRIYIGSREEGQESHEK
jgi:cell division septal protein FtsQ